MPTYESVEDYPIYTKDDLGITYSKNQTSFKVWSPPAQAVTLRLYKDGLDGDAFKTINMRAGSNGVWTHKATGNLAFTYYTYQVKIKDKWLDEVADPYAIACGANGKRAQVIDLKEHAPINWEKDVAPPFNHPKEAIIYEIHLRDISIDPNSGIKHKGKYLGLTEKNTQTQNGATTGLAHLQEMGITHLHILPAFDFRSIDESLPEEKRKYNWGYDPHLYNVPEGTYATNALEGHVRVQEFREMVQALHESGIRVILDVVYNHTGATEDAIFNQIVPDYYYRKNEDNTFSNASACGNETASERPMTRKFILNSVRHWMETYHIDGFRFDLMGIHDIETMNAVSQLAKSIDPNVLIYGEGWTAGGSPLPDSLRALKNNTPQLKDIAVFSDEIRDGIKGHVFTADAKGFISGQADLEESIKFGIVGGVQHPQIDYKKVNYTDQPWSPSPSQCIVYASCHDNHTIWDRLVNSSPESMEEEKIKMQQLALSIVLTSQGIPFLHAGSEFCRTKQGVENSFESPDSINLMDWNRKIQFSSSVDYVKNLIQLRKEHPAFHLKTVEEVQQYLRFEELSQSNLIGFELNGKAVGDTWKRILIYYNGNSESTKVALPKPKRSWTLWVHDGGVFPFHGAEIEDKDFEIPPYSMSLLIAE